MFKALGLFLIITIMGCATVPVDNIPNEQGETCGLITDLAELLPMYVMEKDSKTGLGGTVPNTPVKADLQSDIDRSVFMLAEKLNNDVTAIRSAFFTVIALRNMAPCDAENIRMSWQTMDKIVESIESHYAISQ
ncbi:MAG: hypothetical protein GQ468_00885 [Candidatus Scalindua sp.]|nr:hypothetical protein [Candidatus Scalindua sp.]